MNDEREPVAEWVHVLYIEAAGVSRLLIEEQIKQLRELQTVVRSTSEFIRAQEVANRLITLTSGDAMALLFFSDLEAPVRCAVQIAQVARAHGMVSLRMGLHAGPVYRLPDVDGRITITGSGINVARHVMDCGDAGHILVSKDCADRLAQISVRWSDHLHDLGEHAPRPGERVHLFNFYNAEIGNRERPALTAASEPAPSSPTIGPATAEVRRTQRAGIAVQVVAVSHRRDNLGHEELIYAPVPWGADDAVPEPLFVDVRSGELRRDIDRICDEVKELTRCALLGQPRGARGLEEPATALARHALPSRGFIGLLAPGAHPQFNIIRDVASEIPWEVLEECYFACPRCRINVAPHESPAMEQRYCAGCGGLMTRAGGKLALTYSLSHLVHGQGQLPEEGREFLVIEDPTGDLTNARNDPSGVCRRHLDEIKGRLQAAGYMVNVLPGEHATSQRVLKQLSRSAVVGIYYFGHGVAARDGADGSLLLADGPLTAGEIQSRSPVARFVFLNACEGGAGGRDADFERRHQSVAAALAHGGRKVVIAPLWPVVNIQAAEMAQQFFEIAVQGSVGTALTAARQMSLKRYESGEPHVAWAAYRLFGDPNRGLPVAASAARSVAVPQAAAQMPLSRVFGADARLDDDVFGFEIGAVLLRAAKRRNLQERAWVTTADFCAGLVRTGGLTRLLVERLGGDPDAIYNAFEERIDAGPAATSGLDGGAGTAAEDSLEAARALEESVAREVLARWQVRDRSEFDPALIALLEAADHAAAARDAAREDRRISENDVLRALLREGAWARENLLPPAVDVERHLGEISVGAELDANGQLALHDLDAAARDVIETAHMLAEQRGTSPISHRLLFAAFLNRTDGAAAHLLKRANAAIDPEMLMLLMLAASEGEDGPESPTPRTFGLTMETSERIVWPMLRAARRAAPGQTITEEALFRAFCAEASPGFKALLADERLGIDLNEVIEVLEPAARSVIAGAHSIAQERGIPPPISNRVLLAAFLLDTNGYASSACRARGIDGEAVAEALLRAAGGSGRRHNFALDGAARARAIDPVLARAKELAAGERISEGLLFKAFCDVTPAAFKQGLMPLNLDDLARGQEAAMTADRESESAPPPEREKFDDRMWAVLTEAGALAASQGWPMIRTPHLLAALTIPEGPFERVLKTSGVDARDLRAVMLSTLPRGPGVVAASPTLQLSAHVSATLRDALAMAKAAGRSRATCDDLVAALAKDAGGSARYLFEGLEMARPGMATAFAGPSAGGAGGSMLDALGVDLTEKARRGELPPIVERDTEIETALQTLLLRENANPLLVGDSGVGKTAIVEGLAQRIVSDRCPKGLQGMRLIELSTGALVANTRYRGDFEDRIQRLLSEAQAKVILFIDEIHALAGAGTADRSGPNAGDMLKAALARGDVRLIGATTHAEYKASIARDRALSRRFQLQFVRPPSRDATMRVLSSRQALLEAHHGVRISEEAKLAAVDCSGRHILDRQWPAKARDVLERACVVAITAPHDEPSAGVLTVMPQHVSRVVSDMTGIPVERVSAGDFSTLSTLEERLSGRIIGQDDAIRIVSAAIRRGRQGLAAPDKPWGVFLFVGSPGVGKTELAKTLADEVYGGADGLIRFDMADFSEPHSTAKLIGAPPGYEGHLDGAPLVERLRRNPYSLLLFDEIEHAHDNVLAVLLRLLSEGTLTDSEGNTADCRNGIVILTSNLLDPQRTTSPVGFATGSAPPGGPSQAELRLLLEERLPRKLIDRLDAVVRFRPLERIDLETIARHAAQDVMARVAHIYGLRIDAAPEALTWVASRAAGVSAGARDIRRAVDHSLAVPLGTFLGRVDARPSTVVRVRLVEDSLTFETGDA